MTAESDSDAIRIVMRIPLLGRTEPAVSAVNHRPRKRSVSSVTGTRLWGRHFSDPSASANCT